MRTKTITTILFLLVSMASFAKGTLNDPYTVAEACAAVKDLTWTSGSVYDTTDEVYVKGIVSDIVTTYTETGSYGNASFHIKDPGGSEVFYCFRVLYLGFQKFTAGETDVNVGDEVMICGMLMNYKETTPETVSGKAHLYSLNGLCGTGTLAHPYSASDACTVVRNLTWTSATVYDTTDEVYVKGIVSDIVTTYTETGSYGNASFHIKDPGGSEVFYCFRVLYFGFQKFTAGETDVNVGDEVIIYGKLMNYKESTPETASGQAFLYSLNGMTGNGTLDFPYNVAAAREAVKNLTWTSATVYESTDEVFVKGIISDISSTYTETGSYGNASFHIMDKGKDELFYCFRVYYLGNQKFVGGTDVKVGDEVMIYGKLMNYKGSTPETVSGQAYLYSLNGDIGHPTAIDAPVPETTAPNRYYSPSGQPINGKPTQPGVYIVNGKKVMVINSQ